MPRDDNAPLPIVADLLDLSYDIRVTQRQDAMLKQAAALIEAQHAALVTVRSELGITDTFVPLGAAINVARIIDAALSLANGEPK